MAVLFVELARTNSTTGGVLRRFERGHNSLRSSHRHPHDQVNHHRTARMDKLDDNKFAHLLQPIRDLAANWDINIANELEDYLVSFFTRN